MFNSSSMCVRANHDWNNYQFADMPRASSSSTFTEYLSSWVAYQWGFFGSPPFLIVRVLLYIGKVKCTVPCSSNWKSKWIQSSQISSLCTCNSSPTPQIHRSEEKPFRGDALLFVWSKDRLWLIFLNIQASSCVTIPLRPTVWQKYFKALKNLMGLLACERVPVTLWYKPQTRRLNVFPLLWTEGWFIMQNIHF